MGEVLCVVRVTQMAGVKWPIGVQVPRGLVLRLRLVRLTGRWPLRARLSSHLVILRLLAWAIWNTRRMVWAARPRMGREREASMASASGLLAKPLKPSTLLRRRK